MTSRLCLLNACIVFLASCLACVGATGEDAAKSLAPLPAQPAEDTWGFVADLQSPLWSSHGWISRRAKASEADLRHGVRVDAKFPDPEGLLTTAYNDVADFLEAGNVPQSGRFTIETAKIETSTFEAYRIVVTENRCQVLAADAEGIRRGLFHIEDMMLRAGGPFLPLGTVDRAPFIKTRVSRCFFGPINRPPKNRDELMDEADYYPEQYLNRIAHEGINGLWLSVQFKDLCNSSVVPEFGNNVERRLAKLRQTVEKCRRYGIRVYLFTMEPAAWTAGQPVLKKHPELAGVGGQLFCPWSDTAEKYLYEATHTIFSAVPHLGGMINISYGEAPTTCLSSIAANESSRPDCPVCRKKEPWEILRQTLSPMARGIHDANPNAELIAWLYIPDVWPNANLADWAHEIPKHLPENVILQLNFETGVEKEVFGRIRKGGDYWLSTPGPSVRFERMARAAQHTGASMAAKIQTGNSHEVASVPFVPVPGNLYRKFRAMRELGVTHATLCWYFGNYPGVMNKAAGELSFEPFPQTEEDFLRELASLEWGKHADQVAQAWQLFAEGYANFPLTNHFQLFGPMHDGVVWPLLLRPQDSPLAPTWQISDWSGQPLAPSGDRIGECLGQSHTLPEAIELCRMMCERWSQGVEILELIEKDPGLSDKRRLDIAVARALGIQLRSGLNILRFYDLRERMMHEAPLEQLATLKELRPIVEEEIKNGEVLIELCNQDSRLGFHSEAEGYKYFPEKIRWRMEQLQDLLDAEMPLLEQEIQSDKDVFSQYAGRDPSGPTAHSRYCADIAERLKKPQRTWPDSLTWQRCSQSQADRSDSLPEHGMRWACCHDREAFYVLFDHLEQDPELVKSFNLVLTVETRRMWPAIHFRVAAPKAEMPWPHFLAHQLLECDYEIRRGEGNEDGWKGWMRIPFVAIGVDPIAPKPLRVNVRQMTPGRDESAWITRRPWPVRLLLGPDNPADLGWILFEGG